MTSLFTTPNMHSALLGRLAKLTLAFAATLLFVVACGDADKPSEQMAQPDNGKLGRAVAVDEIGATDITSNPEDDWLSYGKGYDEHRFSSLANIDNQNIDRLGLIAYTELDTNRGHESTPIVVDGMLFVTGAWSVVYAIDGPTGEIKWKYDPQVDRAWGSYACCDVVNRGLAIWEGSLFLGSLDGRLIKIDAKTGEVEWSVQTTDRSQAYTITGAPRVVNGLVVIGNGGAEYGVRGYVSAYHASSGELAWRFYTVPGNPADGFENEAMEQAAETWDHDVAWWEAGGGGTAWDATAFDPELNLLYIGTGNGSPWNRNVRSPAGGDNLYLSSILALDATTGELKWFYQTTPGDSWDYTATQHLVLADLEIHGSLRKVIMQAPKNGFFYVLDRETGELLSADNYVNINWSSGVDLETGRPLETPSANYLEQPQLIFPSPYGGHNWHPMAWHPEHQLMYIPVLDIPFLYGHDQGHEFINKRWNLGIDIAITIPPEDPQQLLALAALVKGRLVAWDPITQTEKWAVDHPQSWNGGVLATGGNLVFQGTSHGDFKAYDASNGDELWSFPVEAGIIAPAVTWRHEGKQYVTVVAGYGGAFALASGVPTRLAGHYPNGRVITFALDANGTIPPYSNTIDVTYLSDREVDQASYELGKEHFAVYCSVCHGGGAVGGGVLPDLRALNQHQHERFQQVVYDGLFESRGMRGWSEFLTREDVDAIHQYIVKRAHDDVAFGFIQYNPDEKN